MRLALIPPLSHLEDCFDTNIQLALPHMFEDNRYSAFYHMMCAAQPIGQHVILDNGAAENESVDLDEFIEMIQHLGPREFALPDALGNTDQTVANAFHFLLDYGSKIPNTTDVGFVAQGKTVDEASAGIDAIVDSHVGSYVKVIYIPRLLIKESGEEDARFQVAEYIHHRYSHLQIHLFGASPFYPTELYYAATHHPYIRSMDTSLPYNYASADVELTLDTARPIGRPNDYFTSEYWDDQHELVKKNVETVKKWASGDY